MRKIRLSGKHAARGVGQVDGALDAVAEAELFGEQQGGVADGDFPAAGRGVSRRWTSGNARPPRRDEFHHIRTADVDPGAFRIGGRFAHLRGYSRESRGPPTHFCVLSGLALWRFPAMLRAVVSSIPVEPSLEVFAELAKRGNVVPVYTQLAADFETPLSAYLKLRDSRHSFLLESAESTEKGGRWSIVGSHPRAIFEARGKEITIREGSQTRSYTAPRRRARRAGARNGRLPAGHARRAAAVLRRHGRLPRPMTRCASSNPRSALRRPIRWAFRMRCSCWRTRCWSSTTACAACR